MYYNNSIVLIINGYKDKKKLTKKNFKKRCD